VSVVAVYIHLAAPIGGIVVDLLQYYVCRARSFHTGFSITS
jgi:hypothetical protein